MKFALNYSPQSADLVRAGRIDIDLFKCPDWPDMIAEARTLKPVYVHFPLVAGQHNIEEVGLDRIADFLDSTDTAYVNTHVAARDKDLPDGNDPDTAVEVMLRDVRPLVEQFGAARVMAENIPVPDIPPNKPRLVGDPAVISRVIEASGCGLLLDLAHACLSASYLGMEVHEYIERLPVDRLREVHVTGIGLNRDGLREDHLPMTEADWDLFAWALENIRAGRWSTPHIIACEYGGTGPWFEWRSDPDVMLHDVPRMAAMIRAAG